MYWSIIYFIIIFQIFFPVIIQRHWVLICVNLLYKTLNFFDSVKMTSKQDIERILAELLVLIVDSTAFFTWTLLMVPLLEILSRFVTTSNVYMTAKISWIWCFIQIYISGFRLLYRSIGKLLHTRYSTLHWTKLLKISWSHVLPSLIFFLKNSLSPF